MEVAVQCHGFNLRWEQSWGSTPTFSLTKDALFMTREEIVHGTHDPLAHRRYPTTSRISFSTARVIVFVVGGVCHSELRAAYEAMHTHGREVSVGVFYLIFLDELRQ